MSQRVYVTTECDGVHDAPVDGQAVELRALGYAVEVDLCEVHTKELRDLVEHLAGIGRPIAGARRNGTPKPAAAKPAPAPLDDDDPRRAPLTCPECGGTYRGPQGLGSHRKRKHGVEGTAHK